MWLIFNLKEEFRKIKESFKKRDDKISDNSKDIKQLQEENLIIKQELRANYEMMKEEIMKLEVRKSEQNYELNSELNKESNYNKVMIQKAVKNRPVLIKQAIRTLIERDMNTTSIFNVIVLEKKLCGKTQFYHYLSLVRSELRTGLRPTLRTKLK